jgi:hypothetical protein
MKTKKQSYYLNCGTKDLQRTSSRKIFPNKKGFIFTLDAALAVLFVLIIFMTANYYTRADRSSIESIQMTRFGSDMVTLLDNTDVLDTLDSGTITTKLNEITPNNYGIRLRITTANSDSLTIGKDTPDGRMINSGKKVFIVTQSGQINDYGVVQYYIWLK